MLASIHADQLSSPLPFGCIFLSPATNDLRDSNVLLSVCLLVHRSYVAHTMGVPDVFSPMKNFTPMKFMLAVGAYSRCP